MARRKYTPCRACPTIAACPTCGEPKSGFYELGIRDSAVLLYSPEGTSHGSVTLHVCSGCGTVLCGAAVTAAYVRRYPG
jgi:hypothetical protein